MNVTANMMFGSISGSAVAAAAAVGGTLNPIQTKEGYDPAFSTAVNVSSCITGLLIPPSNVLIVFSLTAGGVSVASLFMAGYLPGILMGLAVMIVCGIIAKRRGYPLSERATFAQACKAFLDALPSLLLVFIVMGGILGGIFTATGSVCDCCCLHIYSLGADLPGSKMARFTQTDSGIGCYHFDCITVDRFPWACHGQ